MLVYTLFKNLHIKCETPGKTHSSLTLSARLEVHATEQEIGRVVLQVSI